VNKKQKQQIDKEKVPKLPDPDPKKTKKKPTKPILKKLLYFLNVILLKYTPWRIYIHCIEFNNKYNFML